MAAVGRTACLKCPSWEHHSSPPLSPGKGSFRFVIGLPSRSAPKEKRGTGISIGHIVGTRAFQHKGVDAAAAGALPSPAAMMLLVVVGSVVGSALLAWSWGRARAMAQGSGAATPQDGGEIGVSHRRLEML